MLSAPDWVGDSEDLEKLWAEACGYDIPYGLLKKESTTRTFVETKKKSQDALAGISVKDLIEKGDTLLPDLEFVGHTPTPVKSSHKEVNIVNGSEFRLCNLPTLRSDVSALLALGTYEGKSTGVDFHNEASVETATMMLLMDLLKALGLYNKFTVQQQVTQDVSERGDVFILSIFGVVLLILEVKRHKESFDDLTHRQNLGQNYDYQRVNRECASHGYCFGVWMTYKECRIIWLDDPHHNQLAAAELLEQDFKFPLPPDEYNWEGRQVCASKIYKKADNIPKVLACLIWKLFNSVLEAKTVLCRSPAVAVGASPTEKKKNVKFRAVNEAGYFFQSNGGTIQKLNFRLPGKTTTQFYLIRQYNGRDGKVWLSANKGGRLAMVKFRRSDKTFSYTLLEKETEPDEDHDDATAQLPQLLQNVALDDTSLAKAEQDVWKKAYAHLGASPFVVKLASKEALVLPFTFTYQANGVLPLQLSSYLPCSDSFGDSLADWGTALPLLEHSATTGVVNNLFTAIKALSSKFVCHLDIKLDHLALLPVFEDNTLMRLEPILIDLAEVDLNLSPAEALTSMCDSVLNSHWFTNAQKERFRELMQQDSPQYLDAYSSS